MIRRFSFVALMCGVAGIASAEPSNVDPFHKTTWGENVGWMDWFAAGPVPGHQGAVIRGTFMSGFVWCENVGWMSLGDGTPAAGNAYANVNGTDFGVNVLASNNLAGLAWAENLGWVNFDTAASLSASGKQARLDPIARRLRGYAWSENAGWINLDDATQYVALGCRADFNGDGFIDFTDFDEFVVAFEDGDPRADFNGDAFLDFTDFDDFVTAFESGCG